MKVKVAHMQENLKIMQLSHIPEKLRIMKVSCMQEKEENHGNFLHTGELGKSPKFFTCQRQMKIMKLHLKKVEDHGTYTYAKDMKIM